MCQPLLVRPVRAAVRMLPIAEYDAIQAVGGKSCCRVDDVDNRELLARVQHNTPTKEKCFCLICFSYLSPFYAFEAIEGHFVFSFWQQDMRRFPV